jgi:polysaccharide biosynthesis/export protein
MVRRAPLVGCRAFRPMLACLLGLLICVIPSLSRADEYTLDTGDVLRVAIFGEPAYPQDTIVDDRGTISLPLLGEVKARGLTRAALSYHIKKAFQESKLLLNAFVQVDIREYRPFFISGAVANPGPYAFKPGITIRHALAMAGGFKAFSFGSDAPALKIADLRAERANLLMEEFRHRTRLGRLQAENRNENVFSAPSDQPNEISPKLLNDIVTAEKEQMRARQLAFESEVSYLEFSLARAKKDAETVAIGRRERENAAKFQLQQLEAARGLQKKGLVTNTNLLTAERTQNSYLVNLAEADVELARAHQDILNLENAMRRKHADRKMELITEIEEEQLRVAKLQNSLRYVNDKLVFVSNYGEHKTFDDLRGSVRVVVYRGRAETAEAIEATEGTEVRAGDVVEVSVLANRLFDDVSPTSAGK